MTNKEIQAAADSRVKTIIDFHNDPGLILMSRKWFTELAETLNYRIARIEDLEAKAKALLAAIDSDREKPEYEARIGFSAEDLRRAVEDATPEQP